MMTRFIAVLLALVTAWPLQAMDINGELKKALLEKSASDPTGSDGRIYWNTASDVIRIHNGSTWFTIADTTATLANPMTTVGDVIVGGSSGTPARLAVGSEGKVLRVVSSSPGWAWQETYSGKSADYTVTDTDGVSFIGVTTAASTIVVTLPTAADNAGRRLTIKKVDSGAGNVVVDGEGSETIDGLTQVEIGFQYDSVQLVCNGTGWQYAGAHFQSKTVASTFTGNGVGSGTSASVNMRLQRVGNYVSIYIPAFNAQMNTSSSTFILADTAIPAWARPVAGTQRIANNSVRNNANGSTIPGITRVTSSGTVGITKDVNAAVFTNSASAGLEVDFAGVYYIGTGS